MPSSHVTLSRHERQIMDVLYQKGRAPAAEVMELLPDPPSYSSVRAQNAGVKDILARPG